MTKRIVPRTGLLLVLLAFPAAIGAFVPQDEQDETQAAHGDYRNPISEENPAPSGASSGSTFLSGTNTGAVGSTPGAGTPNDGQYYMIHSSSGQPISTGQPFAALQSEALNRAKGLLYYQDADQDPGCTDDAATGPYCRDNAAFRYKDLMYGKEMLGVCTGEHPVGCTQDADCPGTGETCGATSFRVVNRLEARIGNDLRTMGSFYTDTERERTQKAERTLRNALKYLPTSTELRNALLDLYYDRVVAELSFAKALRIDAVRQRLLDPAALPGEILAKEIQGYEAALYGCSSSGAFTPCRTLDVPCGQNGDAVPDCPMGFDPATVAEPGGFRFALAGYFELLNDPMGIDVGSFDSSNAGDLYGHYVWKEEALGRAHAVAMFQDNGSPTPVTTDFPGGSLYGGYKDLVLVFDLLAEYAEVTGELARRYVARGDNPGDEQLALQMVKETQQRLYLDGMLLLGAAPATEPTGSGLDAAVNRWRSALNDMAEQRNVIQGGSNPLGFSDDFVMLVNATHQPPNPDRTTFEVLEEELTMQSSGRLEQAETTATTAQEAYDGYRSDQDQLAQQFSAQQDDFCDRIAIIVGCDPCADSACDPLVHTSAYYTPLDNTSGEIYQQRVSIDIANQGVQRNTVRLENLNKEIQIETERHAKEVGLQHHMANVKVKYGNKQKDLSERIGEINAKQAEMQAATDAVNGLMGGLSSISMFNPASIALGVGTGLASAAMSAANGAVQADYERDKGRLMGQKEQLAADEEAEIIEVGVSVLDVNEKATIKKMLLQMNEIAVDSAEAHLTVKQEQARLAALYREWHDLERRQEQDTIVLASRYFADPIHRVRLDHAMAEAELVFADAQKWVFFLARALEYKWNIVLSDLPGGGHEWPMAPPNDHYSVNSVYEARNAEDLRKIVSALQDYNTTATTHPSTHRCSPYSLRHDFLNLGDDAEDLAAFRQVLRDNRDGSDNVVLHFTTARNLNTPPPPQHVFYAETTWNDKINWTKVIMPGLSVALTGQLSYGGSVFVRNEHAGTPDPQNPSLLQNEARVYSSRFWYFDVQLDDWAFTDDQSSTLQIGNMLPDPVAPDCDLQDPENPPNGAVRDFQQRSVAATGWKFEAVLDDTRIDEIEDIVVQFGHRTLSRN
ncbi:MAG: hypothetical protein GY716_25575 [bacterium]|nr:hypothetical protein [bacterium]